MTLPYERTNAVQNTRNFLRALLDPKLTPKVPKDIRRRAYACLKHYPTDGDIMSVACIRDVFGPVMEADSHDDA